MVSVNKKTLVGIVMVGLIFATVVAFLMKSSVKNSATNVVASSGENLIASSGTGSTASADTIVQPLPCDLVKKFGSACGITNLASKIPLTKEHIECTVAHAFESGVDVVYTTIAPLDCANSGLTSDGRMIIKTYYDNPEYIAMYGKQMSIWGIASSAISSMYTEPFKENTNYYLAHEWNIKSAYAASNADTLSPVKGIWEVTRNISYGFLAVAMVVIGLMIMFRQKIGGQTLVTIQNSIPRVLVVIVLITISYALVALAMDLVGVSIQFIQKTLFGTSLTFNNLDIGNPLYLFMLMWGGFFKATMVTSGTSIFGSLVGIIVVIVFLFIFFILAFKIWFMLISTFSKIFIDVVLLPFNFLLGAFPGNEKKITEGLLRIAGRLLVFPATFFLLCFGLMFGLRTVGSSAITVSDAFDFIFNRVDVPGTLSGATPFFTGIAIDGFIMYGVMLIIPKLPEVIDEFLGLNQSKAVMTAMEEGKKSLGKTPIIGGYIQGK